MRFPDWLDHLLGAFTVQDVDTDIPEHPIISFIGFTVEEDTANDRIKITSPSIATSVTFDAVKAALALADDTIDFDGQLLRNISYPVEESDAVPKAYADAVVTFTAVKAALAEADDTIDVGGQFLRNVSYPTDPSDAATKQYVDDQIAGGGYSDEQAQDAVGTILVDSSTIDFTYNDGTPSITAIVKSACISATELASDAVTTAKILNANVTNAKLANMATATFKGRTTAGTGDPEDLSATQATALLNVATTSLKGLMSSADKTKLDGLASYTVTATKTSAYTAAIDELVRVDPSGGAFTVTLPTASGNTGHAITIKNVTSSTTACTVDGNGSETIDGALTYALSVAYGTVTVVSDGTNWMAFPPA